MKLRIRKVSFLEVTGLNIWSGIKIYLYMLHKLIQGEIRDGNGLVIVRNSRGVLGDYLSRRVKEKQGNII